jgi:hypothetical protein
MVVMVDFLPRGFNLGFVLHFLGRELVADPHIQLGHGPLQNVVR